MSLTTLLTTSAARLEWQALLSKRVRVIVAQLPKTSFARFGFAVGPVERADIVPAVLVQIEGQESAGRVREMAQPTQLALRVTAILV